MNKSKLFFLLMTILTILSLIVLGILHEESKFTKEINCFDKRGNVIKGLICEDETSIYSEIIPIFGLLIIIFGMSYFFEISFDYKTNWHRRTTKND